MTRSRDRMTNKRATDSEQVVGQVWRNKRLSIANSKKIADLGGGIPPGGYVPYTGATQTVDLGAQKIKSTIAPTEGSDLTNKAYVDTSTGQTPSTVSPPYYENAFADLTDFDNSSSTPWTINAAVTPAPNVGQAAKSGGTGDLINSPLIYNFTTTVNSVVVSVDILQYLTEECCDYLTVYLDGATIWSGKDYSDNTWITMTNKVLGAGDHVLEFVYTSDGNTQGTNNFVHISNLTLSEESSLEVNSPIFYNEEAVFGKDVTMKEDLSVAGSISAGSFNEIFMYSTAPNNNLIIGKGPDTPILPGLGRGNGNVIIGSKDFNSTDTFNADEVTIVGHKAGESLTTGGSNNFFGKSSGGSITTGNSNVFMGANSGTTLISGSGNTGIGYWAGFCYQPTGGDDTLDTYCTYIGHQSARATDTPAGVITNSTALGNSSKVTKSNQIVLGNSAVTEVVMGNGDVVYPAPASASGGESTGLANEMTPQQGVTVGERGETSFDSDYIYLCMGGTSWKRIKLRNFS